MSIRQGAILKQGDTAETGQSVPMFELPLELWAEAEQALLAEQAADPSTALDEAALREKAQELLAEKSLQEQQLAEKWLQGALHQRDAVIEARGQSQPAPPLFERALAGSEARPAHHAVSAMLNSFSAIAPMTPAVTAAQIEAALSAQGERVVPTTMLQAGTGETQLLGATGQQQGQTAAIEQTLKLQAPEAKWGEQMLHALRKTVDMQLQNRVQNATIRLDPPELGRLDISLSHDAGRLSIQINAAHADVARLLHQTSERLRNELMGENFVHVDVNVFSDNQQGRQEQAQAGQRMALDEAITVNGTADSDETTTQARTQNRQDVLVTV
ncbi:flagellar hook-length control protein FliK [Alkalilimnicola ehrlichii]|nr:flagellar hook-length control protein FliK [Alkalilimnicola ehrlichii]